MPGCRNLAARPRMALGDLHLLEGVRANEGARVPFAKEESHVVPLKFHVFQTFLRAEVRLPDATASDVAQLGLDHSAQLGCTGLTLCFEDPVNLVFNANDHSFSQFGRDYHRSSLKTVPTLVSSLSFP